MCSLPCKKSVVHVEEHEIVVVSVATKQERTGMPVKWVREEPHGTGHCGYHYLQEGDMEESFLKGLALVQKQNTSPMEKPWAKVFD